MSLPILSIILLSPVIGAILLLLVPKGNDRLVKITAAIFSSIPLLLSLAAFMTYDKTAGGMQFTENIPWVNRFGIQYSLGVDGLSMPLVFLTSIILFCAVFASWGVEDRVKEFFFYMMVIGSGVFGVFMTRDLFLLFLFLETALIPKYILISIWGSKNKDYAALKYTLYLFSGSAIALVGIMSIYLYAAGPATGIGHLTFDISQLAAVKYSAGFQKFTFFVLLLGFGIMIPIWPMHRWTPDGHSAAPTAISMILAGVIMKLGGYALIRVGIQFFPEGAAYWAPLIAVLATISAIYVSLVATVQKDIKFVIANSSVSHMGYVLIGLASLNAAALDGAAAQMFAHGIMAALFFALIGNIYGKTHTRMISDFGGLAHQMPRVASAFVIAGMASLGLPGTFNFVAEFSIFTGSIQVYPVLAVISIFAIVITAIYILWVIQRMFFGPRNTRWDNIKDANGIEMVPIVLLAGVLLVFGFLPDLILGMIDSGVVPFTQKLVSIAVGGIF